MVSIIICSRKAKPDMKLAENVSSTIGCPYEIITIDNSLNNHSIFSAYNLGASRSKYDLLCFMHEDILIKTTGWGNIVAELLDSPDVGVIGVAGAKVKTKSPSPWWIANGYKADNFLNYNIIQKRREGWVHEHSNTSATSIAEVAVLDGVFLCCRREVWSKAKFDDCSFSGFHFYDLDFCLKLKALDLKNYVTYDILLEHNSIGSANVDWLKSAEIFHEKWKQVLPISVGSIDRKIHTELEYQAIRSYLLLAIKLNYESFATKFELWVKLIKFKQISFKDLRLLYTISKSSINRIL